MAKFLKINKNTWINVDLITTFSYDADEKITDVCLVGEEYPWTIQRDITQDILNTSEERSYGTWQNA